LIAAEEAARQLDLNSVDASFPAPGEPGEGEAPPPPIEQPRRGRPPGSKKKAGKKKGDTPEAIEQPEALAYDPGFEVMLVDVTGEFVDLAKRKYNWSEPGDHWREKTGAALSRLLQRIQPMKPGPISDLITLGGYIALWAVPNVISSNGVNAGSAAPGNDGQRENTQDAGTHIQ
jgi:hypothetical protein